MNVMLCLPYESMAPENLLVSESEDLAEVLETCIGTSRAYEFHVLCISYSNIYNSLWGIG
jgi:hypothetical protein